MEIHTAERIKRTPIMHLHKKQQAILINYTGRRGGGPLAAYEMTKALAESGNPVVAVISRDIENLPFWKQLPLKRLLVIPTYSSAISFVCSHILFHLFRKYTIREKLKDYDIKVIYCPMCTFWTEPINRLFPKAKKIVACHDPIPHSGEKYKIANWLCGVDSAYQAADEIIVHTEKFICDVEKRYKKSGHVHYLPFGRPDYYKNIGKKRIAVRYRPDTMNFIFFGRISRYKGLDLLAEAYRNVSAQHSGVTLTIAGDGDFAPYRRAYGQLRNVTVINRWICDDEVESIFTGNNLVAVLPYTDATQSGVALVAMNYGVPVIATDTGGLSEQVEDGVTGILVQPGDSRKLAEKMVMLMEDKQLYLKICANVKSRSERMEWKDAAAGLEEIITSL